MPLTPEEELELLRLRKRRATELSHPPRPRSTADRVQLDIANQLGLPPSQVPLDRRMDVFGRFNTGVMGNTPEEQQAFIERQYPNAQIAGSEGYLAVLPEGSDQPFFVNPPGFDRGDVAQFAGEIAPAAAGAVQGARMGAVGGPWGAIGGAAVGAAAGEYLREGGQRLADTSRESFGDVSLRAGTAGLSELLGGGVLRLGGQALRAARGTVRGAAGSALMESLQAGTPEQVMEAMEMLAKEENITLPKLKLMQKTDNPVIDRLAKQSLQFNAKAKQDLYDQAAALARIVRESTPDTGNMIPADRYLQASDAQRAAGMRPRAPDEPGGGQALQDAVTQFRGSLKRDMNEAWGQLDQVMQRYNPEYDLSGVQADAARLITEGKLPEEGAIELSPPAAQLARVYRDLAQIDPTQDYAAVKALRSRVGDVLEQDPAILAQSNVDIGLARKVYGDLSKVMEDPRGVSPEVRDVVLDQTRETNRLSRDYYNAFDTGPTREIIRQTAAKTPSRTFQLARERGTFDPAFADLLRRSNPKAIETLRQEVTADIMRSADPTATLRQWEGNKTARRLMFPTEQGWEQAKQQARLAKEFNSDIAAAAEDYALTKQGYAARALREGMKSVGEGVENAPQQAAAVVARYGGEGSEGHQALRQVVFRDIFQGSLKVHPETGQPVFDPTKLKTQIEKAREAGYYDGILTNRDQKLLDTTYKVAQRTYHRGDVGNALAVASQVGQMRQLDPSAFVSVWGSARLAAMATAEDITDIWFVKPAGWVKQKLSGGSPLGNATRTAAMKSFNQGYIQPLIQDYLQSQGDDKSPE